MKPEPLTRYKPYGKGLWLVKLWDVSKQIWVWDRLGSEGCEVLEDVKSAVEWLLKEIEKREKELIDWYSAKSNGLII